MRTLTHLKDFEFNCNWSDLILRELLLQIVRYANKNSITNAYFDYFILLIFQKLTAIKHKYKEGGYLIDISWTKHFTIS